MLRLIFKMLYLLWLIFQILYLSRLIFEMLYRACSISLCIYKAAISTVGKSLVSFSILSKYLYSATKTVKQPIIRTFSLCVVTINFPNEKQLELNRISSLCRCESLDSVAVSIISSNGQPLDLGIFCGDKRPPMLMSNNAYLQVTFVSRQQFSTQPVKGFLANYNFVTGNVELVSEFTHVIKHGNLYDFHGICYPVGCFSIHKTLPYVIIVCS